MCGIEEFSSASNKTTKKNEEGGTGVKIKKESETEEDGTSGAGCVCVCVGVLWDDSPDASTLPLRR